ncbi:MAG: hydantoinase B/oxoprolinase family protein [Thermofilaceae archaeon]
MVSWELVYKATVFVAEEMGVALKRSAFSPNIRERVDLSCAVADANGEIIAQAEHIPVHLGSLRVGLISILKWLEVNGIELNDGDMVVANDPYITGTHLNDITLLAPVFSEGKLVAYVVNKAHHVDIGGPVPGSINPSARTLLEEGLVIPPVKLVEKGEVDTCILKFITENSRTPSTVIGDISAQIAANLEGVRRTLELVNRYKLSSVLEAWSTVMDYSRRLALRQITGWRVGVYRAEDYLELEDSDLVIKANVEVKGDGVKVDFSGTSKQVDSPLNAVYGVTFAATSYAVKSALNGDIPINEGFYSIIEVSAPEGSLVNPRKPAPVSGGNLETSQRIVDVVFRALAEVIPDRIPAAGSGTMMNVMLGGVSGEAEYWAYYETIGGGTGGRPVKDGVSGVHVNMTNTLNTPIEIAERNYPLLFTAYRIRVGSGGKGKYRGGDGIVRSFKALTSAKLSILADRFKRGPYGLWGGLSGAPGKVTVKKRGGKALEMPSKFTVNLEPGDEVIICTPGGGGWGSPSV